MKYLVEFNGYFQTSASEIERVLNAHFGGDSVTASYVDDEESK